MKKWDERRRESDNRKSRRGELRGQDLEATVQAILAQMLADGAISAYTHHKRNSEADHNGKDFTVSQGLATVSFGVTISCRRHKRSRVLHGGVPQFHFPIGTNKSTVRARILNLLEAQRG